LLGKHTDIVLGDTNRTALAFSASQTYASADRLAAIGLTATKGG